MFVTGCHRSGTSLLASLLRTLIDQDKQVGDELPPALDNPLGFQESKQLNQLNNQLLKLAGCRWDYPPILMPDWSSEPFFSVLFKERERFSALSLEHRWIEKNPRFCLTAPAMDHLLLKRLPCAATLRSPKVVATSLFRRNGLSPQQGLLIWFFYNHHLARSLQSQDLLILYDVLVGPDPAACLDRCFAFLELHDMAPKRSQLEPALALVDRSLNRAAEGVMDLSGAAQQLAHCCQERYEACCSKGEMSAQFIAAFTELPRPVIDQLATLGRWSWSALE